jgi:hypothetical protein
MAWERRGNNLYYYRSVRDGGRVRKEYVGAGKIAQLVAHADETIRCSRQAKAEREREDLARARELASRAAELDEVAEALARAEMVAAGYRRHKGEWRRRRDA